MRGGGGCTQHELRIKEDPPPTPPTLRAPFLTQFITERLLLTRCSVALLRHSVSYVSAKHPHPPVANVRHSVSNLCE